MAKFRGADEESLHDEAMASRAGKTIKRRNPGSRVEVVTRAKNVLCQIGQHFAS
jgi:hypothetical protein